MLKVRAPDDRTDIMLAMWSDQTLGQARECISEAIASMLAKGQAWSLALPLPNRRHVLSDSQTLQECGLVPNARLYVRVLPLK
ncbi:hypothetical protein BC831DRAFT_515848 [Entophlyctis helioformis]|nr:hypothetical protein BC831DRAFT_515848 [Entophlyctis helioformis]